MRVAVIGASGYVGSRLVPRLVAEGHEATAIGRRRAQLPAGARIHRVEADVAEQQELTAALAGCVRAYYLVHSMAGGDDFAERDRRLATNVARAASAAGVERIVYLGGLGDGDLSPHLASRQEVGRVLADGDVAVVELRAAVALGSGSISFEMLRYLTERLPLMVCPRWIGTRLQPIAERDLLAHLVRAIDDDIPGGVYEIGGADVTTYREMISMYAAVRGLPKRRILEIPVLTPSLSAHWVNLVTPVDRATSNSLIESLATEVVVKDAAHTRRTFGLEAADVETALREALDAQVAFVTENVFDQSDGEGMYAMHEHADVDPAELDDVAEGLRACGGDLSWYGLSFAWRLRIWLGRLFGERLALHRPERFAEGQQVDWWRIAIADAETLVLYTDQWFCGEAWLGYRIERDEPTRISQVGALRTKGLLGLAYWRTLWPIHLVVFEVMAKRQAKVKRKQAATRSRRWLPGWLPRWRRRSIEPSTVVGRIGSRVE